MALVAWIFPQGGKELKSKRRGILHWVAFWRRNGCIGFCHVILLSGLQLRTGRTHQAQNTTTTYISSLGFYLASPTWLGHKTLCLQRCDEISPSTSFVAKTSYFINFASFGGNYFFCKGSCSTGVGSVFVVECTLIMFIFLSGCLWLLNKLDMLTRTSVCVPLCVACYLWK